MLKEGWAEKIFVFDTFSFPDGHYFIKIKAEKDGICDSKIEEFELTVFLPPKADNLLTIKVKDRRDNVGVARQII